MAKMELMMAEVAKMKAQVAACFTTSSKNVFFDIDIDIIYIWILTRYMIVNVFINMFTNIYFYYDVLSMVLKFHAAVGATNDPNGFVSVRLPTQESLPTMWANLDFATSTHRMRERRTTVLPCAEEFRS